MTTRILDIGSEDGSNINSVLAGTDHDPKNICIADLGESMIREGRRKFGFDGIVIGSETLLPFDDRSFDIVYCSSVVEHVTIPRDELWNVKNGREFRSRSLSHQEVFASEIRRVGRQYFVQSPAPSFPIESHTWLPLAGYLPRRVFLPLLGVTNRWWVRASEPDFNLLNRRDLRELFPDARIVKERAFGLTKSLMAVKSEKWPKNSDRTS
jgi:SAM-dependent methyltransferase